MRKLSAILLVLALVAAVATVSADDGPVLSGGGGIPAAEAGTKDVLWEQVDNGLNSLVSEYFEQYSLGVYSADDFENTETWFLDSIYIDGSNNSGTGLPYATSLNWVIYEETGAGEPPGYPWDGSGTEFWSHGCAPGAPEIVYIDQENVEIDLNIALGAPLELPPGHWWISFFPSHDTSIWGQWWWSTADPAWGYDSMVIDPTNFFGMGWTTWTPWTVYDPTYNAFAFRLEGSTGGEPTMHVHNIVMRAGGHTASYVLFSYVRIFDEDGLPVDGADVYIELELPDGRTRLKGGTTVIDGWARFRSRVPTSGVHTVCVTDVVKAGMVYDPAQNRMTCQTLDVGAP